MREAIRILLVEDNPGDARLERILIDEAGCGAFEVATVETLGAAIARQAEDRFDVALLDLSLPDSVGLDTVTRLVAAAPELPVIVLTGLDDDATGMAAIRAGAQDYLVKGETDPKLLGHVLHYAVERARMQNAVLGMERRQRLILDAVGEGILGCDRDGRVSFFNAMALRLLGCAAETVAGADAHELLAPQSENGEPIPRDAWPVARTLADGQPRSAAEMRFRDHGHGQHFPVDCIVTPAVDFKEGVVAAFRDVSDRQHAFGVLKHQLLFQQQMIDSLPVPLFYSDAALVLIGCNRAFEELIGVERRDLLGGLLAEVLPPGLAEVFDHAMVDEQGAASSRRVLISTAAAAIDACLQVSQFRDVDGHVGGLVCVLSG